MWTLGGYLLTPQSLAAATEVVSQAKSGHPGLSGIPDLSQADQHAQGLAHLLAGPGGGQRRVRSPVAKLRLALGPHTSNQSKACQYPYLFHIQRG